MILIQNVYGNVTLHIMAVLLIEGERGHSDLDSRVSYWGGVRGCVVGRGVLTGAMESAYLRQA